MRNQKNVLDDCFAIRKLTLVMDALVYLERVAVRLGGSCPAHARTIAPCDQGKPQLIGAQKLRI